MTPASNANSRPSHHRARHWPRALALALAAAAAPAPAVSQSPATPTERRALLEAVRPQAAQRAGQAVKFMVHRLNVDGDWALLTGELVSTTGGSLNWRKARECQPELDKGLWVLLSRSADRWKVQRLEICATEPPHWSLDQFGGLVWPCGVYAGLESATGEDLQAACRQQPAPPVPGR